MYCKTTLENGIQVVTEAMAGVRSVSLAVLIDAGPQDESPEQSGLAHLTEHALFLGTSSRDALQIARFMDMAGGNVGAFTTRDYTCYYATVLDDHSTYALDLLGDILLNSTFPEANVERERQAILQEFALTQDAPRQRVNNLLKTFAWPSHPLGRSVLGRPETISRLTREDVIYFVHANYVPNRLIVAAAGHLAHEDIVAQVRDGFWRLLGHSRPAGRGIPERRAGAVTAPAPVSQAYFSLGLRACPFTHADRYVLHVLNNLLGGGLSSRLHRSLREQRGLVYYIGSEYHAYRDDGMLVVEGSAAPEHLLEVLELTLAELWRLASGAEPADDEELWKAKLHIRGQHLIGTESTHTRMSRLATAEFYFGHHLPTEEVLAGIDAADSQVVQCYAGSQLVESLSHAAVAVVGPEAPYSYSVETLEALLGEYRKLAEGEGAHVAGVRSRAGRWSPPERCPL